MLKMILGDLLGDLLGEKEGKRDMKIGSKSKRKSILTLAKVVSNSSDNIKRFGTWAL